MGTAVVVKNADIVALLAVSNLTGRRKVVLQAPGKAIITIYFK